MKDDYSAVFRNLRTERTTGRYAKINEPVWLPIIGGIFFGVVGAGAFVLYLLVTI